MVSYSTNNILSALRCLLDKRSILITSQSNVLQFLRWLINISAWENRLNVNNNDYVVSVA